MRKVVLLICPKIVSAEEDLNLPLNLFNLGTYLKSQGVDVRILNHYVEGNDFDRVLLKGLNDCFCVGITAMTAQLPDALRIAGLIKGARPDLPVVFGGPHATLFPRQTVEHPSIDYAVVGEGEVALLELVRRLARGERARGVGGVAFIDEKNEFVLDRDKARFDYNTMPKFDCSLLSEKMMEKIPQWRFPVLTSRGCPYRCRFCINTILPENRRWRAWDAKRAADEVEHVLKLGSTLIYFYDEIFFQNRGRIVELAREIKKRNLQFKWQATTRADAISEKRIDRVLLEELAECGFTLAAIGAESGSARVLDLIKKDLSPEDLLESARIFNTSGVTPQYSFMLGVPGERREDVKKTLAIIKDLSRLCPSARFLGPQLFRPYPGSELYEECVKAGWREPGSIEEWAEKMEKELVHTTPEELPWIAKEDRNFYSIVWFYSVFLSVRTGILLSLFRQYCREYKKRKGFSILGLLGVVVFSFAGKARYALGFYALPFEVKLFKKYRLPLSS